MTTEGLRAVRGRRRSAEKAADARARGASALRAALPVLWLSAVVGFAVFLSGEAAGYALSGMQTAVISVLPTALPSMLICDLYRSYGAPERITVLRWLFSLSFGVSPAGLRAYLLGNLCGFPMGAREVGEAYARGALTRSEAERLIPLSSNPSPPFIVGAVGAAMLGSPRLGLLLLSCTVLSSIACGVIFREKCETRKKRDKTKIQTVIFEQRYSFIESVKDAASSMLMIIAFISSFSVLLGFAKRHIPFEPLRALAFALIEVTGGVRYFSAHSSLSLAVRGALVAFTLGFGGLSVAMQSAAFLAGSGLSMRKYLPIKLAQGGICALLFYVGFTVLGW